MITQDRYLFGVRISGEQTRIQSRGSGIGAVRYSEDRYESLLRREKAIERQIRDLMARARSAAG